MPTTTDQRTQAEALLDIARRELLFEIESFTPRRSGADFREVAVWMVEQALTAAFEAGRAAERQRRTPSRCRCPACGRDVRITPIT